MASSIMTALKTQGRKALRALSGALLVTTREHSMRNVCRARMSIVENLTADRTLKSRSTTQLTATQRRITTMAHVRHGVMLDITGPGAPWLRHVVRTIHGTGRTTTTQGLMVQDVNAAQLGRLLTRAPQLAPSACQGSTTRTWILLPRALFAHRAARLEALVEVCTIVSSERVLQSACSVWLVSSQHLLRLVAKSAKLVIRQTL